MKIFLLKQKLSKNVTDVEMLKTDANEDVKSFIIHFDINVDGLIRSSIFIRLTVVNVHIHNFRFDSMAFKYVSTLAYGSGNDLIHGFGKGVSL